VILKNLTQPSKKGVTGFCEKVIIKNLTQPSKKGVTGFCEK
jgi:hypothetical protein